MRTAIILLIALLPMSLIACGDDEGDTDTGVVDTGVSDSAADSTVTDSGPTDSAPADTAPADSAPTDSGPTDTGTADSTLPDGGTCIPEGGSRPVVPSAPPCCAGLAPIPCDTPGGDGSCDSCTGSAFCTDCGDGTCDTPENACNCAADCS